ncbi:MAG TPA: helix-turn-helix transcriptional regulator [Polyangiales bacterium]|jgi:transcriptional regulator with XRE-family HTH domain|nr:helix-turn-helix transcriptional regulator [Polyangiales bacterium]
MVRRPSKLLGERLRKLRARLKNPDGSPVTQAQVAARCGWSADKQWRYEDGRNVPSAERQVKLAKVLGTTVEELQADNSLIDALPLPDKDSDDGESNEDETARAVHSGAA